MLRDARNDVEAQPRITSPVPDPVLVRAAEPSTVDNASVVALSADGAIVGRATVSRLYGARGAVALELAPTTPIALALIDSLEGSARALGLAQLEIDAGSVPTGAVEALRRSRTTHEARRGTNLHLTWPTTQPLVTS
jgi:hypothetical protein